MGKRQNRVVSILLLANRGKDHANNPLQDTKNTKQARYAKFDNLIYVNCTREQKDLFYAYQLLSVEHQINK